MFVKTTVAVALLASFAAAQTNVTFDPTTVDLTTRGRFRISSDFCKNASNMLYFRSMVPGRIQHLQGPLWHEDQREQLRRGKAFSLSVTFTMSCISR
jgi:hypothetical protein